MQQEVPSTFGTAIPNFYAPPIDLSAYENGEFRKFVQQEKEKEY